MPDEKQAIINGIPAAWQTEKYDDVKPGYLFVKRLADILLSAIGLIVLAIPMIAIAAIIPMESKGLPIYKHKRAGKNGKEIRLYKFRSMYSDERSLEELLTPEQLSQYYEEYKVENDPRITGIGNFIRRTSIDELPQLINILKGDISIIGPRPITEDELCKYGPNSDKLLSVKPGLTGYWQAYGRSNVGYSDGKRQAMELFYINNRSIHLDIKIFLKTVVVVIKRVGAK
jgi:lipopolysaccharide/colanic/teichoic acid biosynthesis glycosyltransferase